MHNGLVTYKEVQGLSKGLDMLRALNRAPFGVSTVADLARACGLHRTTTKRLLETLCINGLVRRGDRSGQYCLTFGVRSLSEGFQEEEWVERVATPRMRAAVPDLLWWCDLATLAGTEMVVRESTHRWSNLAQERAMIGQRMPLLTTAVGRAYLAWAPTQERRTLLSMIERGDDEAMRVILGDRRGVLRMLSEARRRGYSVNWGEWSLYPHISAVGVPLISAGRLVGAMTLGFPNNAIRPNELAFRFVPRLITLAQSIGKDISSWMERD